MWSAQSTTLPLEGKHGAGEHLAHRQGSSSRVRRQRPGETTFRDVFIIFPRSHSIFFSGDSSGVGNNPFWVGRNLCLTLFMWIIHLGTSVGLRLSGRHRLFRSFFPRRMSRRKKIRGSGSQAASRRGARPRTAALALKARARQYSAILSTVLDFSRACIPSAPWLLVLSRSKHLSSLFFLFCLLFFAFGLRGHGGSPVADGSMFAYESGLGVSSLINQEGSFARIAQAVVLTPIFQTVAQFVSWGISISARSLACVVALVSVLALATHPRSRAVPVVPAPGVRTPSWSLVVPASGTWDVPAGLPPPSCDSTACFKLLGAAIGTPAWCELLLGRRVRKARALIDAIGRFPDSHGAFCLLRSCSGWAKVLYSCRTVPPDAQPIGLRDADTDIRLALGRLVGSSLSDDDWRLASLGIASGGVGARSASEHAPAAYIASFAACRDLCCVIWPSFDPLDLDEGCRLGATESALGASIPAGTSVYAESHAPSQRSLSAKLEARSVSSLLHDPALTRARRCHLAAVRAPGSGAWLTATPASSVTHIPSPLFRTALRRRLPHAYLGP